MCSSQVWSCGLLLTSHYVDFGVVDLTFSNVQDLRIFIQKTRRTFQRVETSRNQSKTKMVGVEYRDLFCLINVFSQSSLYMSFISLKRVFAVLAVGDF